MKYLGEKSLSRVLQVALTIAWWGVWLAVAVAGFIFVWVAVRGETLPPPSGIRIDSAGLGLVLPPSPDQAANRVWFLSLLGVVLLPSLLTMLYVIQQLRRIMATLVADKPFLLDNAARVRRIGFAVLVLALVRWIGNMVVGVYVAQQIAPLIQAGAAGTQGIHAVVRANPDLTLIFFGVLVLILAEVFRRGAQLQEESDLTV